MSTRFGTRHKSVSYYEVKCCRTSQISKDDENHEDKWVPHHELVSRHHESAVLGVRHALAPLLTKNLVTPQKNQNMLKIPNFAHIRTNLYNPFWPILSSLCFTKYPFHRISVTLERLRRAHQGLGNLKSHFGDVYPQGKRLILGAITNTQGLTNHRGATTTLPSQPTCWTK